MHFSTFMTKSTQFQPRCLIAKLRQIRQIPAHKQLCTRVWPQCWWVYQEFSHSYQRWRKTSWPQGMQPSVACSPTWSIPPNAFINMGKYFYYKSDSRPDIDQAQIPHSSYWLISPRIPKLVRRLEPKPLSSVFWLATWSALHKVHISLQLTQPL